MLTEKKRLTFGVVIDYISGWGDNEYYQTKIIAGVADYAKQNDLNVICFVVGRLGSNNECEKCRNLLFDFVSKNHVDGLIILPTAIGIFEETGEILTKLEDFKSIPIVTLTENYGRYNSITTNNYLGIKQITDHVIEEHNSARLAFISGPKNNKESQERFQAFYDSLREHNLAYYPELTFEGDFLFESGKEAVKYFTEKKFEFDAIICANDNMAIGVITQFHKQLGKIPEHLSITGFDDAETSKFHALTTVKQPFYEQAQAAAIMLHKLIMGEQSEWTIELPSEVILRSSCGCIGYGMNHPATQFNLLENDSIVDLRKTIKNKIQTELVELNKFGCNEDEEELLLYENNIIDAFYSEFFDDHKMEFLNKWNSFVFWMILKRQDLSFLLDILATIRENVLAKLVTMDNLIHAENIFHAANMVTSDAIQRTGASLSYLSILQTEGIENLSEDLMSHLDIKTQMDSLYRMLPEYNMKKGYIAIYEDEKHALKNSKLILAFNGKNRLDVGSNGLLFETRNILPADIMKDLARERFNIIIMALHQGDRPIGYSAFSFEDRVNKFYENVRYTISVALNGALLVESIKNQALDLEKQVEERTLELSKMNNTLIKEIQLRKDAQEQLGMAMKELKLYNSRLKMECIRDELTGLYNRRGFMKLSKELLDSSKSTPIEFLLLFGDLDNLKNINDQFGHTEGDYAIRKTAELLNQTFENASIISRLSGDEFLVVITGATSKDEHEIREKLLNNCNHYNNFSNKPYVISLSMGFAYFDSKTPMDFDELFKEADKALNKAKLIKNSRLIARLNG